MLEARSAVLAALIFLGGTVGVFTGATKGIFPRITVAWLPGTGSTNVPVSRPATPAQGGIPDRLVQRLNGLTTEEALTLSFTQEIPGVDVQCAGTYPVGPTEVPVLACQWGPGANMMTEHTLFWRQDGRWRWQIYPSEGRRGKGHIVRLHQSGTDPLEHRRCGTRLHPLCGAAATVTPDQRGLAPGLAARRRCVEPRFGTGSPGRGKARGLHRHHRPPGAVGRGPVSVCRRVRHLL